MTSLLALLFAHIRNLHCYLFFQNVQYSECTRAHPSPVPGCATAVSMHKTPERKTRSLPLIQTLLLLRTRATPRDCSSACLYMGSLNARCPASHACRVSYSGLRRCNFGTGSGNMEKRGKEVYIPRSVQGVSREDCQARDSMC